MSARSGAALATAAHAHTPKAAVRIHGGCGEKKSYVQNASIFVLSMQLEDQHSTSRRLVAQTSERLLDPAFPCHSSTREI